MAESESGLPDARTERFCTWAGGKRLKRGTKCQAKFDFKPEGREEMALRKGDFVVIERPCSILYWYHAVRSRDKFHGIVPVNYLEITHIPSGDEETQKSLEVDEKLSGNESSNEEEDDNEPKELPPGSEVEATDDYIGNLEEGDLSFKKGDLMYIIHEDEQNKKWYFARKASTNETGLIPSNYTKLIYIPFGSRGAACAPNVTSEQGEEDEEDTEPVYEDFTSWQAYSGWFTFLGHPLGLQALYNVLAKKAGMTLQRFMDIKKAIYILDNFKGVERKQFIGGGTILHKELASHFMTQGFEKPAHQLTPLERELLFHSPDVHDWKLEVDTLRPNQLVNSERAKKIVQRGTLHPDGFNCSLVFETNDEWLDFAKWFFPKSVLTPSHKG